MGKRWLYWIGLTAWACVAAAPVPPEVTDEEDELLRKGKIAVRSGIDDVKFKVMGIIEIDAPAEEVWTEILDFDARLAENRPARAFEMYRDEPVGGVRHMAARWDLRILGQDITYYETYHHVASEQLLTFTLDPEKESDLARIDGYYQTVPSPILEGGTRLVYVVDMDTGRKLPESFQKFLANHSLKETLLAIRRRAEQ